jgi:microcystin-dependent protein
MSDIFIGEIRLLPYNFAPVNFVTCDGSSLAISQYAALYSLIGTTYGGDGVNTFGIPDLRGRVPVHQGISTSSTVFTVGQVGGSETVPLLQQQIGPHTHAVQASTSAATAASPNNAVLAAVPAAQGNDTFYADPASAVATPFATAALRPQGGGQPHANTAPTLALRYCIATDGIYPSRP